MKNLLAITTIALLASTNIQAKCFDRYYYYTAKPTPTTIKNWQIYEDRSLEISKEIKDFLAMNANCSPAISGESHNFTGYFNYIVDANAWSKIKKPLYKNLSIRLANGALGNGQAQIITIDEYQQKQRQAFKQYSTENNIAGKTSAIYVFIVRKGIDQIYTPQLNVSFSKSLIRDGYYFTEYKQ